MVIQGHVAKESTESFRGSVGNWTPSVPVLVQGPSPRSLDLCTFHEKEKAELSHDKGICEPFCILASDDSTVTVASPCVISVGAGRRPPLTFMYTVFVVIHP